MTRYAKALGKRIVVRLVDAGDEGLIKTLRAPGARRIGGGGSRSS